MSPQHQSALEALIGRALTQTEVAQIAAIWSDAARPDAQIAALISVGRTEVRPCVRSARGIAESIAGGPLAAEAILLKLEGARDALLASADQQQHLLGSLLRRQLAFLAGDGLDLGSPALRAMLDQFAAQGILTADDAAALKAIAQFAAPIDTRAVTVALNGV